MKTIKSLKDITTLEVGDVVIFGDLKYTVYQHISRKTYFLEEAEGGDNDRIFKILNLNREDFIETLGIKADCTYDFPETKSLEALTAIVSALFKEYEKQQNELPKTWEEFCKKNPLKAEEYIINATSKICITKFPGVSRNTVIDKNYLISKQEAEAFLALMQLRQLWHDYVGDFEFDWAANCYFCIFQNDHEQLIVGLRTFPHLFCFPTKELAEKFLTNFKDLLKIAKPLL